MSFASWALQGLEPTFQRLYSARKRRLFGSLSGRVLEVGAGTGLNRQYLAAGVDWLPLEPDPSLREVIADRFPGVDVLTAPAEAIPLPEASVDAVICSLVLCSVTSPQQVLQEVLRVLKPGGCLVLVEHVAAPPGTWLAWFQHRVRPVWKWVGQGCHPDRDTGRVLAEAGFSRVDMEHFSVPLPVVSPHLSAVAWK